jgi:hypothetical protein
VSEDPVQEQAPASDVPQDADAVDTPEAPEAPEAPFGDPDTHRFECRSCGFVYDPGEGVKKLGIVPGTPFSALDPV